MNAEDTDDDKAIANLIDRIQDVLEGERMDHVMNALFSLIGNAGAVRYEDMTKREFIAGVVEDIGDAYEYAIERRRLNG